MKKLYIKLKYKWSNVKLYKKLFLFYFLITILGSLILYFPFSHQTGQNVTYLDALFTSSSAFSDTGLVSKVTAQTWNYFGQSVIAILIVLGGIGLIAFKVYVFNILFRIPMSYKMREILNNERGGFSIGKTKQLIKYSITTIFSILIIASFVLSFYFYFAKPTSVNGLVTNPYHNLEHSIRFGIFHSISAINNAGFDIIGTNSLVPYYKNFFIQFTFIFLFVLGGIGYPVIHEIIFYIKKRIHGEKYKFSLFSKLSTSTYFIISFFGVGITLLIESTKQNSASFWNNSDNGNTFDKIMALFFNSMSTRNAGFATIDLKQLDPATLLIYSILMFIGSAPSSTAGGIRTTTFAIVILVLWSKLRNRNYINVFKRKITNETILSSISVFVISIFLILFVSFICLTSTSDFGGKIESQNSRLIYIIFEVASAFGTTGLSTGITPKLNVVSKIFLIFIMFVGQLGLSTTISTIQKQQRASKNISYMEEKVIIG